MSTHSLALGRTRWAGAQLARLWRARFREVRLGDAESRRTAGAFTAAGCGALASGLLSALASKILAALGGPAALASLVTLQQARQGALIAATVNGQTAVIQGASSRSGAARREYVRTAALLFLAGTSLITAAFFLFPGTLRRVPGFAPVSDAAFRWLAVSVVFASIYVFLTSILNAEGQIGTLAVLQVVAPGSLAVALAAGLWPPARAVGIVGPVMVAMDRLAWLLALSTGMAALAAAWPLMVAWPHGKWVRFGLKEGYEERGYGEIGHGDGGCREGSRGKRGSGAPGCAEPACRKWRYATWWSNRAARAFLSISLAMLVTGLIASGTVIAVRGRIIAHNGLAAAGCFDAAWNISMNHTALLLAALQTYCLPALSRARSAREQSQHIAGILKLAMPAAAIMIAVLALAKPLVIELFYAPSFRSAAALLRWTLLGDYLKIGSWIISLPLLARADMKAFLLLDTAAYATFAGASVVLSRWLPGAESAAAAFACMYAVHLAAGAALTHWRCGVRFERSAIAVWSGGLLAVAMVSGFTWNRL